MGPGRLAGPRLIPLISGKNKRGLIESLIELCGLPQTQSGDRAQERIRPAGNFHLVITLVVRGNRGNGITWGLSTCNRGLVPIPLVGQRGLPTGFHRKGHRLTFGGND